MSKPHRFKRMINLNAIQPSTVKECDYKAIDQTDKPLCKRKRRNFCTHGGTGIGIGIGIDIGIRIGTGIGIRIGIGIGIGIGIHGMSRTVGRV